MMGLSTNKHAQVALAFAAILPACGCSWIDGQSASTAPAAPAPVVDPYADIRPATASVGVAMPDQKDFLHPWDVPTYVMRVTLFGTLPPMNGGVAFVGDSLTDVGRWSEAYPGLRVRNFGIFGDTTVGLQHRISQVVDARPGTVFLQIGTNDIEYGRSPEAIAANIDGMIDSMTKGIPGVKIYVESLLPRQPEYDAKVRAVNALLKVLAEKRGLTYIDLYSRFAVDGRLNPRLTSDDIHLSGQGYEIWRDVIRDYVTASAKGT
jgi:lysophospholipase L1-like esterase